MITYRRTSLALLTASALGLAACGSDGGDGAAPGGGTGASVPDDPLDDPEGEDVGAGPGGVPGAAVAPVGDDVDLTDANSRVVVADCGALPVLDAVPGASFDAPGTLVEGQPARAGIDPGLPDDGTHYWRIDLQPGYHHLFVDTRRLDAEPLNLGLEVRDVDAEGGPGERLMGFSRVGYRTRAHEFFRNATARTVTLAVTPTFEAEDYVIGVFANGRAVPSPFFEDCPDVAPLSVGTTEAVELTPPESADDYVWYRIDLARDRYAVEGTASRLDGEALNIIYEIESYDGFGDGATETRLLSVSEVGAVSTDRSTFAQSPAGSILLRLYSRAAPLELQFTVSPDDD